ncbi:MAG: hypothetical protein NTV86_07420 [Planctomycetota bacterium]|nr:hypothetical protein [Planctomycetota bacterium]
MTARDSQLAKVAVLACIGAVIAAVCGQEVWLSAGSKAQPQEITCADLIANGFGDNRHVLLKGIYLFKDQFVHKGGSDSGHWRMVWAVALPKNGTYVKMLEDLRWNTGELPSPLPPPTGPCVVFRSDRIKDMADLHELADKGQVEGVVTDGIDESRREAMALLSKEFPGIDFSRCHVVTHERKGLHWAVVLLLPVIVAAMLFEIVRLLHNLPPKSPSIASAVVASPMPAPPSPAPTSTAPPADDDHNPYAGHKDDR